jgi:hypothetical protein
MIANGKVMFPEAVRLVLTRPTGVTCELRYFDSRYAVIAGRVDDFIVPLPKSSTYTLRLPVTRLWCPEANEGPIRFAPGRYRRWVARADDDVTPSCRAAKSRNARVDTYRALRRGLDALFGVESE